MRPSQGKKIKQDDSDNKFRDKIYRSMYPSPCSSYDPNKWLQNNDISWLSHSIEQDIDKILQIAVPQPLKPQNNRRASANDIREEVDDKIGKQKRNTWYVDTQHEDQPKNSKLKINMSSIICEFPIQKVSRQSNSEQPKTPNGQKSFMEAIIQKYQQQNDQQQDDQFEKEKQYLFQNDKKSQILDPQIKEDEINENIKNDEQQSINSSQQENIQKKKNHSKPKRGGRKKKTNQPLPKKKSRQTKKQARILPLPQKTETEFYQEKTKQIRPSQTLDQPIFNTQQSWARMSLRKEAKKYQKYQTQEFKDLLRSLPGCFIHKSEGDLKIDKIRPMQNVKRKYFQSFEMWINPQVLIGPINLNTSVKLHVRFKKGYSGHVFCDSMLSETLPLNQVDGKTFHKQKLILANNSDHVIKLICCSVNITIRGPQKRRK